METTPTASTISNASASEAYASYALAFDVRLRAVRGLPVADKATKIEGHKALIRYIDAKVASGRGADCRVTISWEGGEPSCVLSAAERREHSRAAIAALEAGA